MQYQTQGLGPGTSGITDVHEHPCHPPTGWKTLLDKTIKVYCLLSSELEQTGILTGGEKGIDLLVLMIRFYIRSVSGAAGSGPWSY